jgi:predicted negative regulator of RcsB-dependent stress response
MRPFILFKSVILVILLAAVSAGASQKQLSQALEMVKNNQLKPAIPLLFVLSKKKGLEADRTQIKYILGTALIELKLHQAAVFQLVEVIRDKNSKYTRQAIEKLSIAADALGDETLLNYAVSRVEIGKIPANQKDMIYFRLGEIQLKNRQFEKAIEQFNQVRPQSRYYPRAQFGKGLALLEAKKPKEAYPVFQNMYKLRSKSGVIDDYRVSAIIAMARAAYQAEEWERAVQIYRLVPRDHELWHDALFEMSWALLRAAKFRSVLSNFQSLHSSYYENYYLAESLLLRSIVYLFICKYDEMDKVLDLFDRTYNPMTNQISNFIKSNKDPLKFTVELEKARNLLVEGKQESLRLPVSALKFALSEGDVKSALFYIERINIEKKTLEETPEFANSAFLRYANKVLNNRIKNTRISLGEMVKSHLQFLKDDLQELYEQAGFIRYEMINGKKESLKKKIAGTSLPKQIDEDNARDFYIQNGFEYWPFDGEFWLDEIGNFHYLGKQSCD